MKVIVRAHLVSLFTILSAMPVEGAVTFSPPAANGIDHVVACIAQNLGVDSLNVEAALIDDTGAEVDSARAEILPGRSVEIVTTGDAIFYGYCRFEFDGDPRNVRTYVLVREPEGGDTEALLPAFEIAASPVVTALPRLVSGAASEQTFSPPVRSVLANFIGCIVQNLGREDVEVSAAIFNGAGGIVDFDAEVVSAGGVRTVVSTSESVIDAYCVFSFDGDPARVRGYLNSEPPAVCYTRLIFPATEREVIGRTLLYSPPLSSPLGEALVCQAFNLDDDPVEVTAELIDTFGVVLDDGTEMVDTGHVATVAGTTDGANQAFCKFTFDTALVAVRGFISRYPMGVGSNTNILAEARQAGGMAVGGITTYSPPLRSHDGNLQCTVANFSEEQVDVHIELDDGTGNIIGMQDRQLMPEQAVSATTTATDFLDAFCTFTFDGSPAEVRGFGTLTNVAASSTLLLLPAEPIGPSPTPTSTATETPTPTPTSRPTFTPTEVPTDTPTPTLTKVTSTPTELPTSTPTDTASVTPTSAQADTPTSRPEDTPTSTPEPTSTPVVSCVGDCDGDGSVTVDEILKMVNIALGSPIEECPAGDRNGDGDITVDEILAAVANALDGCPG